jgi:dipeptidyl aminopeptidase/acylaminoacyl peptidase
VNEDIVRSGIFVIAAPENLPSDAARQPKPELVMTDSVLDVQTFSWSPDGKRIAFEAQEQPGYTSDETARIYVVDLSAKKHRKLVEDGVPNHKPMWSPDGSRIAFMTIEKGKPSFPANIEIAMVNVNGGAATTLTKDFDESARLIDWGPDGIYFGVFQLESAIYRMDPSSGKRSRINPAGSGGLSGATFPRDHKRVAGISVRPNLLAEVCVSNVDRFAPAYLTDMNAQRSGFRFATREAVRWKSLDGTEIEGILIKPADYDPGKKYPLLVVIHGGPATLDNLSYTPDRDYPIEMFAAKGALLLKPNYRGSTGYGEKLRTLIIGNLGIGPYEDMISGVDSLIAKGLVDPTRLGVMGWSQGGHNTAFAATYSNRFKAASVGAGITDWTTYYVNTDLQWFTRQLLQATPWENPAIYAKHSPITYATKSTTPVLIQHGSRDPRVPVPDAFELYRALKDRNVPTKLVLYSGYGHIIDKPKGQLAVMQHNWEWFLKYIWGETAEAVQ